MSDTTRTSEMYVFIGTAMEDFSYGGSVLLQVGTHKTAGEGVPNTSNIENEEIDEIKVDKYKHENTVSLHVPDYMAGFTTCEKGFTVINTGGKKGQQFLIGSIQYDLDQPNLYIIAKI